MAERDSRIGVVVVTRNRADELSGTLRRLTTLPERPPVVVVDNGSTDHTARMVRADFPGVRLVCAGHNLAAVGRNVGVAHLSCPYVAFSDDDSWWRPGALARAQRRLDADPRLGLLAAHTLVAPRLDPDPINAALAVPVAHPGPAILGFLGCAAVVRRTAFRAVGGYHRLLFFVGEERLLAYDLAAAGWRLAYAPDVLAVHRPSPRRPGRGWRDQLELRNEVLTAWLRRPVRLAARRSVRLTAAALRDPVARRAWWGAARRLPAALAGRRRLPAAVEAAARALETGPVLGTGSVAETGSDAGR